mgnify:CR=1 FL=1
MTQAFDDGSREVDFGAGEDPGVGRMLDPGSTDDERRVEAALRRVVALGPEGRGALGARGRDAVRGYDAKRRELLERHPRHRTSHATLISTILDTLAASAPEREARGRACTIGHGWRRNLPGYRLDGSGTCWRGGASRT